MIWLDPEPGEFTVRDGGQETVPSQPVTIVLMPTIVVDKVSQISRVSLELRRELAEGRTVIPPSLEGTYKGERHGTDHPLSVSIELLSWQICRH